MQRGNSFQLASAEPRLKPNRAFVVSTFTVVSHIDTEEENCFESRNYYNLAIYQLCLIRKSATTQTRS